MNIVSAKYLYARSSSQKLRLVANLIKNKKIVNALNILTFTNKKSAKLIKKTLLSAIANAEYRNFNKDNIIIQQILVTSGPTIKRIMPRAKGKVDYIKKRTSHIKITLLSIDSRRSNGAKS
ncbi:MAG: 50S ribosomal protein L22 [Candidatus Lightella neohaematopini]|nr:50S ribosomal protein L22 [Candidatus Lightella neohaematopini]